VPLELFRVIRTTGVVGGEQRVDGLEAPFVGRDRELRMVKELFHATAEDKRARLVLVAGDPGIGKSRLAWEFEKYLDAIKSHWAFWMRGRCLSYGQGVAGRVVAEMVRSLLRVTDNDDESTVSSALDERLQRHVHDETVREVLRPRLESLLGLSDRAFEQADMFASWRGFFEALTHDDDGSVVTLVVEDLQWADDAFLDFLDYLLESAQAPIMVLAMARPEITTRRAGIGVGRRATTVFLDPLTAAAMNQLLEGLVGNLPESLRDELVRRADGIPLYAVETVRSLIDRDVVVPAGGRYVVDPAAAGAFDLAELSPPASLHALLAARLDALTADERRVVQDGSVLGLTFTRAGIEALTTTATDLDEVLNSLRRKEILSVDNDPRSPERGQYRFVQALLRGVAYDTLSRRDRKSRHIAVAEHLTTNVEGDAIAGVLAQHYLDAAAAVPEDDDIADLQMRAADMLERAALHATDVGAPADALTHYGQMMALDLPADRVIRVAIASVPLARRAGTQIPLALEWVERGLALVEGTDREDDRLALLLGRSHCRYAIAVDFEGAQADALSVLEASAGTAHRVKLTAAAARQLGVGAQITGNHALAQHAATMALQDVERYGDDNAFAMLLDTLSMWFGLAGYRRLTGLVRRAAADQYDSRSASAISLWSNLAAGLVPDDPEQAATAAMRSMECAREFGMTEVMGLGHLTTAYINVGRWSDAEQLLRAHAQTERSELVDWETYLLADSAVMAWERDDATVLYPQDDSGKDSEDAVVAAWWSMHDAVRTALAGDLARAAEIIVQAVDQVCAIGVANEDVPLTFSLAVDMLLEVGDHAALKRVTEPFAELPLGQRFRLLHGQLLRVQAMLSTDPVPGLREAVSVLDGMGAAFWAARTRVDLAGALADAGDASAAVATLSGAEPLLRECGAARALRRVDALRASEPLRSVSVPRQVEAEPVEAGS
jgi:hypothetical protein